MDMLLREEHEGQGQGRIVRLVMNATASHNALSLAMIEALIDAFGTIGSDETIRAVILASNARAFSPGHDLREMQAMRRAPDGAEALAHLFARCATLMQMLTALHQPVIAEVGGIATAAGCQLVASCDLAVAAPQARFGVNGVSIGLFCTTPMVALTRAIPPKAAFEMLVTGDFISAGRARELGLINRVAAEGDLAAETMRLAQSIAAKLPAAIRMGKRAFHDLTGQDLAASYDQAGHVMCRNTLRDDTAEGIAAFLEKRPPRWP